MIGLNDMVIPPDFLPSERLFLLSVICDQSVIHCPKNLTGRRFPQPLHYIDEDPFSSFGIDHNRGAPNGGDHGGGGYDHRGISYSRTKNARISYQVRKKNKTQKKKKILWGFDRLSVKLVWAWWTGRSPGDVVRDMVLMLLYI
jgi:hypothetical protein